VVVLNKQEILQLYLEEAFERTQDLGNYLIELEKNSSDPETIQTIFRCAHTLKGNSTTVYNTVFDTDPEEPTLQTIDKIGKLTHAMENLIMEIRDNGLEINSDRVDLLFETETAIEKLLRLVELGSDEEYDVTTLHSNLKSSVESTSEEHKVNTASEENQDDDFVGQTYKITLNCDEAFKHAFLSLVYKDIQDKYNQVAFTPSFDDLMVGTDFTDILVKIGDSFDEISILSFIKSIENVEHVEPAYEKSISKEVAIEHFEENDETNKSFDINNFIETPSNFKDDATSFKKDKPIPTNNSIKVSIARIDDVFKHVSNLVILKNKLLNYSTALTDSESKGIKDTAEEISQTVEFLQESVMSIRMTPLDHLFNRFPKDVRNIAKEFGKKVSFNHLGGNTEIDKSLLDKLGDPLMHLIRNSVFHGIESESERISVGKEPVGNLTISAKHEQSMVVITVEDDGGGIDIDRVVKKAIDRNLITEEKALLTPANELANLIFHPGLSTAESVTSVAGRGVGMDVVRSKIAEDMKGQIEIDTQKGKGTKIIIRLPFTLAIINAMLTKIGDDVFAFSSSQVESVEEIREENIKHVANSEVYVLKERNIEVPIIRLNEYFGIEKSPIKSDKINLVILKSGVKTVAVTVDEFIGHEDIVLKNMGRYLGNIPGIGGCNVLGNGDISLIVDVNSLLKSI
jgi:two-component system, chemotaxis family, sensor kinase CheA